MRHLHVINSNVPLASTYVDFVQKSESIDANGSIKWDRDITLKELKEFTTRVHRFLYVNSISPYSRLVASFDEQARVRVMDVLL